MLERERKAGLGRRLILALAAAPLWIGYAAAEPRSLIDPADAHVRRELRSLDSRLPGSSEGARIQLERTRRAVDRPGNGIDYLPEGARLGRDFDRIERDLKRPVPEPTATRGPARDELPSTYGGSEGLPRSYDGDGGTAAGGSNNLVTVTRLLNRAEVALERGRANQARSDLATARTFLDDVLAAPPVAGRREALADRLETLERRTDAAEDG